MSGRMEIHMEIGGYFGLEQMEGHSYHKTAMKLNSGRNCFKALIRSRKIERIYLPYYICDSVIEACKDEGCQVWFYYLGQDFMPLDGWDTSWRDGDYFCLVNYGGLLTKKNVLSYLENYKNIILDNTQAFFAERINGVDTIYSCRKFFGVPDGAYLYTSAVAAEKYETDISYDRMIHILGRYELGAERFYEAYVKNEAYIAQMPVKQMSRLTDNIMRTVDYKKCESQRSQNYSLLYRKLRDLNRLNLPERLKGAFAYPLYVDNAEDLRKKLIDNKIFIPQYWKEVLQRVSRNTIEYQYAQNILWIPCDQRYTAEEMNYIVDKIEEEAL